MVCNKLLVPECLHEICIISDDPYKFVKAYNTYDTYIQNLLSRAETNT